MLSFLFLSLLFCATTNLAGQPRQAATPPIAELSTLVHERSVDAPIDELWRVFSTSEGFKTLGPAHADVDLRIGGQIRTHYDPAGVLGDAGTIVNEILAFDAPRMLAMRIQTPPRAFPFQQAYKSTWTVITLTQLDAGRTQVRLDMAGWSESAESQGMRAFFASGNDITLQKLASAYASGNEPAAPEVAPEESALTPIVVERVVAAPRAKVWHSLATADGWHEFFGVTAQIGSKPMDPFEIWFAPDAPAGERGAEGCNLLALVPEELLSFTWNAPPKFPGARFLRTWVVVDLVELAPNSTRVRLRHLGFADLAAAHAELAQEWPGVRAYFAAAWPRVLDALCAHHSQTR